MLCAVRELHDSLATRRAPLLLAPASFCLKIYRICACVYFPATYYVQLQPERPRCALLHCWLQASEEERARLLSFVVCGGGPTGVEVAAELHDMMHHDLKV